ncbi:MAG: hypothetical protein V1775_18815 [Bacteroidota bacterium]
MKHLFLAIFFILISGRQAYTQETKVDPPWESPVSFVFTISPTSLLICPNKTGFTVLAQNGAVEDDVIVGLSFNTPNIKAGIGFNSRIVQLDFLAGAGCLISGTITGSFITGDAYCRFRPSPVISIGVHAGLMNFTPQWDFFDLSYSEPDDVKFSKVNGLLIGPVMSFGKRTCFTFSLDYTTAITDVSTYNGYNADRNKLDLGGLMLNYGLLIRVP